MWQSACALNQPFDPCGRRTGAPHLRDPKRIDDPGHQPDQRDRIPALKRHRYIAWPTNHKASCDLRQVGGIIWHDIKGPTNRAG